MGLFLVEESSSVLSFDLAKCICLPIRCNWLASVHNAQYTTDHLGGMKSCIGFLEPSWVDVRLSSSLGWRMGA
eukprot:7378466-Ditylum_brightwellii.AAC.1